ncbi:MAG: NAD/NADP octopine/nopaline dehydrogenase family protein [Ruminococcus sp.]|nr:NAD/NADP octopine/nopaline dehydrogenase family protein [Ruminococcus sp.]
MRTWAIIGGGNGGQTFAAHLAIQGERVRLFSKSQDKIDEIGKTNTITLHHGLEGAGKIEFATTDMKRVLDRADNIVIILPSTWHEMTARMIIPHLVDGQSILLLPEASCGALAFRNYMREMGCSADVVVGAGATLPYATRLIKDGEVNVFQMKNEVEIAALPATDNNRLMEAFSITEPVFIPVHSTLKTSIDNINALMHGAPSLLNVARIEADPHQDYQYYKEGVTPTICHVLEQMDQERIAIAHALGFEQRTLRQEYIDMYSCGGPENTLYELLRNCDAYDGLMAQRTLKTRYIMEDIPYSLVPISALGQIAGVPTPVIDTIIQLGRIMIGPELNEGRTAAHLGIEGMSVNDLKMLIFG